MLVRGPRLVAYALVSLLLAAVTAGAQAAPHAPVTVLGAAPVCEASAARWVPCADDAPRRCVIVGDNEVSDKLFLFSPTDTGELAADFRSIAFADGVELKDVEAIDVSPRGLLVFGSHSRKSFKKHCARDPDRLVFAELTRQADQLRGTVVRTTAEDWAKRVASTARCLSDLIVLPRGDPGSRFASKACHKISKADREAETKKASCDDAFNIEGVVWLPGADGTPRVWVGLRGPTVGDKAVLLRLSDLTALRFDAIALIAMGKFGVRDLAYSAGSLWVLAGPTPDKDKAGTLWTVPAASVVSGADLQGHRAAATVELPAFSEGLAIDEETNQATVVVDGDHGHDGSTCATSARQLRVALPAPGRAPAH